MTITDILILALALSLDAMIVCFSYGLVVNSRKIVSSLSLACFCGFFQFLMPIIGYYLSSLVYTQLKIFSKWIVCIIFMCLAIKFIKEALSEKKDAQILCISFLCMLGVALATSIDALGAGVSIRFSCDKILSSAIFIGVITFFNSIIGFWTAGMFKRIPSKNIELAGGLLLIYLAISAIF